SVQATRDGSREPLIQPEQDIPPNTGSVLYLGVEKVNSYGRATFTMVLYDTMVVTMKTRKRHTPVKIPLVVMENHPPRPRSFRAVSRLERSHPTNAPRMTTTAKPPFHLLAMLWIDSSSSLSSAISCLSSALALMSWSYR